MRRLTHRAVAAAAAVLLLPAPARCQLDTDGWDQGSDGHFCGLDWTDANNNCYQPCPTKLDSECTMPGHSCHAFTGCVYDVPTNPPTSGATLLRDVSERQCSTTWGLAMLNCNLPCDDGYGFVGRYGGDPCPAGMTCHGGTNCNKPMEEISVDIVMGLLGDYPPEIEGMDGKEIGILEDVVVSGLSAMAGGVAVDGADVTGQELSRRRGRRGLLRGAGPDGLDATGGTYRDMEDFGLIGSERRWAVENLKLRRRLYTSSSALDVSMTITGGYRPPPYIDTEEIVEDSINRAAPRMTDELRERGQREGSELFKRVRGVEAVRRDRYTPRPTSSPVVPTVSPTEDIKYE